MTTTKKRPRRRSSGVQVPEAPAQQAVNPVGAAPTPMPEWHWRTLPVFLMFFVGALIGLELGILIQGSGSDALNYTVFFAIAAPLGFAFSRVVTRWLLSRQIIKPRPRPATKGKR